MEKLMKIDAVTSLRRMFYFVTPNETMFQTFEEVPEYMNEATPLLWLFMLIEVLVSLIKQDKKYRMNDALTSISAGIFSRLPMMLHRSIVIEGYKWTYRYYRIQSLPWDSPWTWWLTFFGVDFGYYWFHRLAHEVNFLWAFHQTHHSSEDFNFSTSIRQSAWQTNTSWCFYLPMAFFIPPSVFLVHYELNILYQFWIHTQYIKSLGPLEYILNTPSHHRVHHGRNPYCIDKNYGGNFIIWDRLFGTFQSEEEEVVYGLTEPVNTFEPFTLQFGYLLHLFRRLKTLNGFSNWVKNFMYGPGWSPGKPRFGDLNDLPKIQQPVRKWSVKLPLWKSVYVFIHFVIFLVFREEVVSKQQVLSNTCLLIFVIFCAYTLACFGLIFDNRVSSTYFELGRCVICLLGEIVVCQLGFYGDKGSRSLLMSGIQCWFAFSTAIWFAEVLREASKANTTKQVGNYVS